MNKKEVLELRRRLKKESVSFSRLCACYVDGNGHKVCKYNGSFLNLEDDEFYKYLEIASKTLSGTLGNQLLNLEFPLDEETSGGRQQILMALRETGLEDEALLDTYYDLVIDAYDHAGNYLILFYHDIYDVMKRTKDQQDLDESEEAFRYLLCAICPVELSKPGLGYREDEQRIGARIRDWVVGAPETGFLFPAFNDRSTDIHATLFYTKNTKEPHTEFMSDVLGCPVEHTATEQKMAFHSIVRNALGAEDERTEDRLLGIQQNISEMIEEHAASHDEEDAFLLDAAAMDQLMEESKLSEEEAGKIRAEVEEVFGEKPLVAEHVIDAKALEKNAVRLEKQELETDIAQLTVQLGEKDATIAEKQEEIAQKQEEIDHYKAEVKTYDVVLHVKPQKAEQISEQMVDGKKCLVIPMEEDEQAVINGMRLALS